MIAALVHFPTQHKQTMDVDISVKLKISRSVILTSVLLAPILTASPFAHGEDLASPALNVFCSTPGAANLLLQAEALGIAVVDRTRLAAYMQAECAIDQPSIIMTETTAPEIADYSSSMMPAAAELPEIQEQAERLTKYRIYGAADLSRGNRYENDYAVEASREQALLPQLLWGIDAAYTLLEDYYTEDFYNDDLDLETRTFIDKFTTMALNSELTYQSVGNPKMIGFTDISYLRNDFTGVQKETSLTVGGGYAIWGDDYHADCAVLKYSAGVGRRGRALYDESNEQRNFVSHKVSFKYLLTDSICVSVKHSIRQFIGHSDENIDITSFDSKFNINELISLTARYLYSNDKGVQDGFEAVDERLRLGIEVNF